MRFPKVQSDSLSEKEHLNFIYTLFDEYWANRWSFEITEKCFPLISPRYQKLTRTSTFGFLRGVIKTEQEHKHIESEILKFRIHGNIERFMQNIQQSIDEISKSIAYFYSYIHHYEKFAKLEPFLDSSKFTDESTKNLGNFFRENYENNEFKIHNGIPIIENMLKLFGLKFEDQSGGLYINVLNI